VPRIGYHAPHEQHRPSTLLAYVQQAEDALFEMPLHNVHRDQETFIRYFAEHVLPNLDR
jgi:hypothetical protein